MDDHIVALPLSRIIHGQPGRPDAILVDFIGVNHQEIDLTFMRVAPALCLPFVEAFAQLGSTGVNSVSRANVASALRAGFFRFLQEERLITAQVGDLTEAMFRNFMKWLGLARVPGGKVLKVSSRENRLGALRRIFATLRRLPRYTGQLENVQIPPAPWPRLDRHDPAQITTQALSQDGWDRLYFVCASYVQRTMHRLEEGWQLMHAADPAQSRVASNRRAYADLGACLARLNYLYPDVLPPHSRIYEEDHALGLAMSEHGINEIISYFHPSSKMLFPFVLLLAMHTGYNLDPLIRLSLSQIEMEDVLGEEHLLLAPFKARSGSHQPWSFSTNALPDEPGLFIPFVQRWTARVRRVAPDEYREHLFLFLGIIQKRPTSFAQANQWHRMKKRFCVEHSLPDFNIKHVRVTFLDTVRERSGNDPRSVQSAAGHRSVLTQALHYTTGVARQRNDEHLGHLMNLMERWVGTDGRIDPRGITAEKRDWGAATPGFVCLDPKDSPQPGEVKGRACAAYGACITCPLAVVDTQNAHNLVRLLQLRQRIEEAQQFMAGNVWLAAWAFRLERLTQWWLPAFHDHEVLAAAEAIHLPPLPSLLALE